jgi:hypothetical protein
MEIKELQKKQTNKMPPAELAALIKKKRTEDEKMIRGKFEFTDAQGGWFEFANRIYPGELIKVIKIFHGEVCELPMGIVRLINNCVRKVRRYNLELPAHGGKTPRTYDTVSRIKFVPVDWI